MTTCNGAKFVGEQLMSLEKQTRAPHELVICDDESSDETMDILEAFRLKAPFPVHVYRNSPRLGYKDNFAKAASMCAGDFIAFCDQDDIWMENKIERLEDIFFKSDCLVVAHDLSIFSETKSQDFPSFFAMLRNAGSTHALSMKGCSLAIRRRLIEIVGWPPLGSGIAHDTWVCLLSTAVDRRIYIEEPLIRYRLHQSNVSGWLPEKRRGFLAFAKQSLSTNRDFEEIVLRCMTPDEISIYAEAISSLCNSVAPERRQHAQQVLDKWADVTSFRSGRGYADPLHRFGTALRFAMERRYIAQNTLRECAVDILGRRKL
jgi:glycosyltransferase involved in cell wall biosynthesis